MRSRTPFAHFGLATIVGRTLGHCWEILMQMPGKIADAIAVVFEFSFNLPFIGPRIVILDEFDKCRVFDRHRFAP